ncbi:unnamed protein product [Meloidogyne enterolobii]|uniref:Uncharacterized protein n=1 Tax=Meloidogyne enterolobii TaxID=390850 RepID=A0ACB1AFM8_MELEN
MGQTVSHQYGGIYGPDPQMTYCPKCGEYTLTRVTYVMGPLAWCMVFMFALVSLFIFCFLFPLIFLPFCFNFWKDAEHRCGVCNTYIGKFIREYEDHRYGRRRTVVVIQPPPPQPQVQPVIMAHAPPGQAYTPPTSPPPYPPASPPPYARKQ